MNVANVCNVAAASVKVFVVIKCHAKLSGDVATASVKGSCADKMPCHTH